MSHNQRNAVGIRSSGHIGPLNPQLISQLDPHQMGQIAQACAETQFARMLLSIGFHISNAIEGGIGRHRYAVGAKQ